MDLFEKYTEQPPVLKEICDKYAEIEIMEGLDYSICKAWLKEVESIGYTFDYGLDASPYNLRKIEPTIRRKQIENCKAFIRENFLVMPSVKSVALYSLFVKERGTFTDEQIIKQALKEVKPEELYKR